MKCKICGREITWDNSYGHRSFLVCHSCFEELYKKYNWNALEIIFDIGKIVEKEVDK